MEIMNPVDGMNDRRHSGTPGRQSSIKPGHSAMRVQNVYPVLTKHGGDSFHAAGTRFFPEIDGKAGDPGFLELFGKRAVWKSTTSNTTLSR